MIYIDLILFRQVQKYQTTCQIECCFQKNPNQFKYTFVLIKHWFFFLTIFDFFLEWLNSDHYLQFTNLKTNCSNVILWQKYEHNYLDLTMFPHKHFP